MCKDYLLQLLCVVVAAAAAAAATVAAAIVVVGTQWIIQSHLEKEFAE